MAWRSRSALPVLAAAIVILLLAQTDVAKLLLRPFIGAPLNENVVTLAHRKTYYAESKHVDSQSVDHPLKDADDTQQAGVESIFDEEGQSVDADFSLAVKYDYGETMDMQNDAAPRTDDAPDGDYDYYSVDDSVFPKRTEPSADRVPAFNVDHIFGTAAGVFDNEQDSTEGQVNSDVNDATQPSNVPAGEIEARLESTVKPLEQFKSNQSPSGNAYAASKRPGNIFVFGGTGGYSTGRSSGLSGNNGKNAQPNDQKFNFSQQPIRSLLRSKLVAATPATTYNDTASIIRTAVTNNNRGTVVKQSGLNQSTLPTPPAGILAQLSSVTQRQATSSIKSPEGTRFISSINTATDFAAVVSKSNFDSDRDASRNSISSLASSSPVVRFTQGDVSSRALSQVSMLSNDRSSNKGKIISHPTLASTTVPGAVEVNEVNPPIYDSVVTGNTYTSAINRSSSRATVAGDRSIQRMLTTTAAPGSSLETATSSERSQRSAVSLAISASPVESSNLFTVSSSLLSMGMTRFSEKLLLVSAHSDFRKSPPTVKIVVFAHKDFKETVSCVHRKVVRPAWFSWINYVTEERALWRAGYLECKMPAMNASVESTVELRSSSAVSDAGSVIIPIGHTLTPRYTSATVSGTTSGSSTTTPTFGLCVKSGYGAPSAARFVEWMELHTLLGVAHVILYDQNLHGPVLAAMQHYVDSGRLTVVRDEFRKRLEHSRPDLAELFAGFDATFASGDEPYAQMELLSIQDCFHRFRGMYDYILVADIDEAIVPVSAHTLPDLVAVLKQKHPHATSFSHQAAAYLPHFVSAASEAALKNRSNTLGTGTNSSNYSDGGLTYMLNHTRHTDISWDGSKAFHSTGDTDVLNWHKRIWPDTNVAFVRPVDAWLHHYRASCKGASCDPNAKLVNDSPAVMGRYAAELTSRVAAVMRSLSLPT